MEHALYFTKSFSRTITISNQTFLVIQNKDTGLRVLTYDLKRTLYEYDLQSKILSYEFGEQDLIIRIFNQAHIDRYLLIAS